MKKKNYKSNAMLNTEVNLMYELIDTLKTVQTLVNSIDYNYASKRSLVWERVDNTLKKVSLNDR